MNFNPAKFPAKVLTFSQLVKTIISILLNNLGFFLLTKFRIFLFTNLYLC